MLLLYIKINFTKNFIRNYSLFHRIYTFLNETKQKLLYDLWTFQLNDNLRSQLTTHLYYFTFYIISKFLYFYHSFFFIFIPINNIFCQDYLIQICILTQKHMSTQFIFFFIITENRLKINCKFLNMRLILNIREWIHKWKQ